MHLTREGTALRIDFDFHGHAGYAIARQSVGLDLPENYQFVWRIRGDAPPENLEFKLLHGDDVWWLNRQDFVFPRQWTTLKTKKRQIAYAWGPSGGGEIRHADAMEIVVTAGSGGRGTVWIDDVHLEPLPVTSKTPEHFTTSSIDLGVKREVGGLEIDWVKPPRHFTVIVDGAAQYGGRASARPAGLKPGLHSFVWLPDVEAKTIRITGGAVRGVTVEPPDWAPDRNAFFAIVAHAATRGDYPRYLAGEQPYWTVVGNGREPAALVGEDGNIEPFKGGFSIEPFLFADGSLITWASAEERQSLADGYLPIPSVQWKHGNITMTATAAVSDAGTLSIKYRVRSDKAEHVTLFVALRPFQVNPSTQFLNLQGGAASPTACRTCVHPLTTPHAFGSATFDDDLVGHYLRRGTLPHAKSVHDDYASSAWSFPLRLKRGVWQEVVFVVPLRHGAPLKASFDADAWRERLNRVTLDRLPPKVANTIRSTLAYILIQRDGPALQPGSRSYARSWIRDGALMAPVLLRLGHAEEAKAFARWFAKYQFGDGKVPCCVDRRGADPVPENDSHGEFIFLVAEIYRATHDVAFVRELWPHVDAAAAYINRLRSENHGAYEGLVTESISHEGYSAKPVHSYWDDFFALKGLEDAAMLARVLGVPFRDTSEEMTRDIQAAIERSHAAYIPGSVELDDFDPSATAVAVAPLGLASILPRARLEATFDRYLRTQHGDVWTPYEMRIINALLYLGRRDDAARLLGEFLAMQRPAGWNEWPEVIERDARKPRFIGDMPHAWGASDFVRAALDFYGIWSAAAMPPLFDAPIAAAWPPHSKVTAASP